jgi:hypothetical protein
VKMDLFLFSSASWGRNPPYANTCEMRLRGNPHREQNLVSFETCCCPQFGQCICRLRGDQRRLPLQTTNSYTKKFLLQ